MQQTQPQQRRARSDEGGPPAGGGGSPLRDQADDAKPASYGGEGKPLLGGELPASVAAAPASPRAPSPPGARRARARARGAAGCRWLLACLAGFGGLYLLVESLTALDYAPSEFVKVEGTEFSLGCRPFLVSGFTVENIGQAPMAKLRRKLSPGSPTGRQMVRRLMQTAAGARLNVMRTFAHTTGEAPRAPRGPRVLESDMSPTCTGTVWVGVAGVRPGEYDEDAFRALDFVLAEAGRAGIRVLLSFAACAELEQWGAAEHVRVLLERRNAITGRRYRDDPAILGFNLINEPRCSVYEVWYGYGMGAAVRGMGGGAAAGGKCEGFWSEKDSMREGNPGMPASDWAQKAGQEFIENHDIPLIDFCSIHDWPDNWQM
eukprot:scaffold12.g8258.t1